MVIEVDPVAYWKEKGKTFYQNFNFDHELTRYQEQSVIVYLKNNISENEIKTVFEIGCGFGRFTKLILEAYKNIETYYAIDLSMDQLENAKKYVDDNRVNLVQGSIKDHQFMRKYDLVFAGEVFFHIRPEDIEHAFRKTLLLTEKYLIYVDLKKQYQRDALLYYNGENEVTEFAFFHDYDFLMRKLDVISTQYKYTELKKINQAIYHVIMK